MSNAENICEASLKAKKHSETKVNLLLIKTTKSMNLNNFTIKAQEAVQKAIEVAQGNGQQMIEPAHLLKGVMVVGENVTSYLFQKLNVNTQALERVLDKEIESYPRVSGGDPMLSREANAVFRKAMDLTSQMGDNFVSLEHLLMAIVRARTPRDLERCGRHPEGAGSGGEGPAGEKVTSQTAEDTYQALSKYAVNLIEMARG